MNELGGYAFADLRVGMCATFAKTVTEADIVLMAHAARIARDLLSAGEENTAFLHAKIATANALKARRIPTLHRAYARRHARAHNPRR